MVTETWRNPVRSLLSLTVEYIVNNLSIYANGLLNLLKHTNQLYFLVITNCDEVNDNILECLSENCPNLMGLDVGGCNNVTDVGVKSLSKLKKLTWLTLSQTQTSFLSRSNESYISRRKFQKFKAADVDNYMLLYIGLNS
ncbi:hypothetical protein NQ314_015187 [Rhamnusium bicolor]|uniref:F-box/LRR-repeat protein 15-like leucin rich repeat domain-containing protein n=1 Tax=Rhamnusium bicolor TaxID=1586634 RepID=A0AAV8X026_9CUCU|nr:hypothetical protein NQ314_015187 [Rhamnusium bicolor]